MKLIISLLILNLCVIAQQINVKSAEQLEAVFSGKVDSVVVHLQPGNYNLTSKEIIDSTCGNCQDPDTVIDATAGLIISGNYVKITGAEDHSSIINTNSGYGLFILNCKSIEIKNLTITGGMRDTSEMASDAAIVVKNSGAVIKNNIIRDNIGDSATVVKNVVGIMGIVGRENAKLVIAGNQILRNSWDGITLYRDAEAVIKNNVIDGVDKAISKIAGGGRGVALGVTWNATAEITGNLLKRYWKGIGIFVDARASVKYNIVEDMITWGIAYWDAGIGKPVGFIENNIVYSTGACGVSVARETEGDETGFFKNNVIVRTGQNEKYDSPEYYCSQCALAVHAQPESFEIIDNIFFANRRATEDLPDYDSSKGEFAEKYSDWIKNFENSFYYKSDIKYFIEGLK